MAAIGDLRAQAAKARADASEAETRLSDALRVAEIRGDVDGIEAPPPAEYRVLTNEQAIDRLYGRGESKREGREFGSIDLAGTAPASDAVMAEVEREQRKAIEDLDRHYAENMRG